MTRPATVTVPQGALAAYVAQVNPKADVAKVLKRQDINWNSLYLREEGSSLVEYKAKCGTWALRLIGDVVIGRELINRVAQGLLEQLVLILEDSDLRGRGAGVDYQNFV